MSERGGGVRSGWRDERFNSTWPFSLPENIGKGYVVSTCKKLAQGAST
jgi:hypothetical protein